MERNLFGTMDYVVCGASLFVSLMIGVILAVVNRGNSTAANFLVADRKLKTLPLTISLVVSVVSAVTILGLPAEMYQHGSQYFFNIGSGLGILLTAFIFVPLLHPLQLTSMFEYLEIRFKSRSARLTGSVMEILALLMYGGTALFAPATALAGVTPFSSWMLAVALGAIVTIYTTLGGLKGVIWTDVFQAFIMLAGILAVIIQGCAESGGLSNMFEINRNGNRLHFYNFDPDPTTRHTFWGLTLGFCFGGLSFYGGSQFTFQRFTATKTTWDAKKTVLFNLPTFYAFHLLLCFTGLIIYAYYASMRCDPIKDGEIFSANQLLPLFVVHLLGHIPGLSGLFVASLTSGALSTLSSVMNSVAALVWEDFLKQPLHMLSQYKATLVIKLIVCVAGACIVGLTFLANSFGPHIFQVCFAFLGATGGPQLGMLLLAALIPWSNGKGAISGCLAGVALMTWIVVGTYVYKPFTAPLPAAPVDGCQHNWTSMTEITTAASLYHNFENTTNIVTQTTEQLPLHSDSVFWLYRISYTWYSLLGSMTCLLVGMLVSAITGGMEVEDSSLVLPWYNSIKRWMRRPCLQHDACNLQYSQVTQQRKPETSDPQKQSLADASTIEQQSFL